VLAGDDGRGVVSTATLRAHEILIVRGTVMAVRNRWTNAVRCCECEYYESANCEDCQRVRGAIEHEAPAMRECDF
jgi:hypothetical protein